MAPLSKRIRVALEHSVTVGGHRYTELRVRPAKPKDLAGLKVGDSVEANLERGVILVARMCGVPEAVIYALDPADAGRVGEAADARLSKVL
ncbi:phage tail assembly protein [Microvirga thermotolerans]|uniref:Uncharacterized protein n=1 Tax=Microvirga thermotolerans TaxID=2651334 RepID=A0A5P9JUS1_9HYPH|nr:phage tail assembly protein [Microvirga thermotolerans]QFU16572.1 hypothetical protein GDR74_10220 [Microvirga thermotolerans]